MKRCRSTFKCWSYAEESLGILMGLFDAALKFDSSRTPKLFCGFP